MPWEGAGREREYSQGIWLGEGATVGRREVRRGVINPTPTIICPRRTSETAVGPLPCRVGSPSPSSSPVPSAKGRPGSSPRALAEVSRPLPAGSLLPAALQHPQA